MVKPMSCNQEKHQLKSKISTMEKTLSIKDRKLKELYDKVLDEKDEVEGLTKRVIKYQKQDYKVARMEREIEEKNLAAENLMNELDYQKKLTKDTFNQLYSLREDSIQEIENAKKYVSSSYLF